MRLKRLRVKLARRQHEMRQWVAFRLNSWLEDPRAGVAVDGDLAALPRNVCIFAASNPGDNILASVQSLLGAIKSAGYGLFVVINGPPVPRGWFAGVLEERDVVVSRPNRGRDFAAYQLATNLLLERGNPLDRLLYFNDSVFYLDKNDRTNVFSRLIASEDPWVGVTESMDKAYHIASWCFQLSHPILKSRPFADYWRQYLPVDSRLQAIREGEIGISQALLHAGYRPTVLFTANCLLRAILTKDAPGPTHSRSAMIGIAPNRRTVHPSQASELLRSLFEGEQRSQAHWLGLLMIEEMGFPFLKKDVVYRDVYPMSLALLLLEDFITGFGPETVHELRARGMRSQLPRRKKLLFDAGAI